MRVITYLTALITTVLLAACGGDGDNVPLSSGAPTGGTTQPAVDVESGSMTGST
ncbi:MAG: hypothetical protein ACKVJG_06220 [Candidatus Latescibacterota bacterium]|jgi:hypothetical protein